jgi:methionine biosynthesis protein MetW
VQPNVTKQTSVIEHKVISSWISSGASVLDLGCGDGDLLNLLIRNKQVHAQGVELSEQAIHNCVAAGLSVFQQDIDTGLTEYSDKSVDYVILNQTLQQVKKPDFAIREALRVGKKVIVGFPNFCYITDRFQIFFRGKVPVTSSLPFEWYDTPNLHFLSIADFKEYTHKNKITVEDAIYISKNRKVKLLPNLLAEVGLFLLSK